MVAVSAAGAYAADMPGNVSLPLPPPPRQVQVVPFFSGWYVRGDIGAHWGVLDSAQSASPFPNPTDNKLNQGVTASIGVGIKSDWLRTDVTIDYISPLKYQGTIANAGDTTAKIQTSAALFNGYIDLGTWYRLTPYIGGGIGAAYTRVTDYASPGAPPFSGDVNKNQWGFALAAVAGVAFPISHNMMIDIGYRYLNVGDVKTNNDAVGDMTFKNVAGHEARIGLRWNFDDFR